ncbi:Bug family tripartite tricarboxylate transporter substrate binding protein [Variovorax saccharolyticus]|uniref:Bug family tripartite tricarboxylate transporter substrate binding protein n=1 Tax=Variovorax saccharolyticus TaxID=3053516 RepID=UPI0025755B1E|nr:tripartite tricarboxylate transporter substrate binding protein [Variovorax sp. J31P216]MDM0028361.1 tripartite tricarboxylate transporter substrate binding protein [Variovorax sp. J31P216]
MKFRASFASAAFNKSIRQAVALSTTLAAALLLLGSEPAQAQAWPTKAVKMIVPFPAGAAPDVVARLLADRLTHAWGQSVYVENRPGAGAIPGMSTLARSPSDGYTIGFVPAAAITLTPALYKAPQYNVDTDIVPVAIVATGPMMVAVNSQTGITSLAELSTYAKAHPGKVNFAAAQPNSVPHLTGEMLSRSAGLNLFTIPYSGSQTAVTAVLAGDATLTVDGLPALVQHVKAGKLRAIAVTSAKRLPGFEDVPAVAETYPGFDSLGWFVLFVPTGVPSQIVEQMNRDVNKAVQDTDLIARFAELGVYPRPGNAAAAKAFLLEQRAAWKKNVAELGLQPQ